MRGQLAIGTVMLVACESAEDFPGPPQPLSWQSVPLERRTGTLDGTGYAIELPRGIGEQPGSLGETTFTFGSDLTVRLRVEPDPPLMGEILAASTSETQGVLTTREQREDGWLVSWNGGREVYSHTYVGEGALECGASVRMDNHSDALAARALAMCKSLVATTPLANPATGDMTRRKMRAMTCRVAAESLYALRPAPAKKKRLTRAQAAERDRKEAAERATLEARCMNERWPAETAQCIVALDSLDDLTRCDIKWTPEPY